MQVSLKNVGEHILTPELRSKWQQRLDAIDAKEKSSLFHSIRDQKKFQELLDSGSDPNEREDDEPQNTILMKVARTMLLPLRSKIGYSTMLLMAGADINAVNTKGLTALAIATEEDPTLALFLLDAGADPKIGATLAYAREYRANKETLRVLEESVSKRIDEPKQPLAESAGKVLILTPDERAKPWYMLDDDELDISSKIVGVNLPSNERDGAVRGISALIKLQAQSRRHYAVFQGLSPHEVTDALMSRDVETSLPDPKDTCPKCGESLIDNPHNYCGTITATLKY